MRTGRLRGIGWICGLCRFCSPGRLGGIGGVGCFRSLCRICYIGSLRWIGDSFRTLRRIGLTGYFCRFGMGSRLCVPLSCGGCVGSLGSFRSTCGFGAAFRCRCGSIGFLCKSSKRKIYSQQESNRKGKDSFDHFRYLHSYTKLLRPMHLLRGRCAA